MRVHLSRFRGIRHTRFSHPIRKRCFTEPWSKTMRPCLKRRATGGQRRCNRNRENARAERVQMAQTGPDSQDALFQLRNTESPRGVLPRERRALRKVDRRHKLPPLEFEPTRFWCDMAGRPARRLGRRKSKIKARASPGGGRLVVGIESGHRHGRKHRRRALSLQIRLAS